MAGNVFTDELEGAEVPKPSNAARASRETQERAMQTRPMSWTPPELLPEIDREPGYEYRWVRAETNGMSDPKNMSAKAREGWEPESEESQPRAAKFFGTDKRGAGVVEYGGLVLCKRPIEFGQQRTAYYRNATHEQTRAVDNNLMKQNDPRMPLFRESNTKVSFGKS